jgi:hypothetical protein
VVCVPATFDAAATVCAARVFDCLVCVEAAFERGVGVWVAVVPDESSAWLDSVDRGERKCSVRSVIPKVRRGDGVVITPGESPVPCVEAGEEFAEFLDDPTVCCDLVDSGITPDLDDVIVLLGLVSVCDAAHCFSPSSRDTPLVPSNAEIVRRSSRNSGYLFR